MVRSGLVTAWRLAGWPTSRSPSSVKATIDGVVRMPSAFSMTFGLLPSITATQELVVPRSMPITLAMVLPLSIRQVGRALSAPAGKTSAMTRGSPLVRPPEQTLDAAPCGVLAHIGGPIWAARLPFTDSRAIRTNERPTTADGQDSRTKHGHPTSVVRCPLSALGASPRARLSRLRRARAAARRARGRHATSPRLHPAHAEDRPPHVGAHDQLRAARLG